MCSSDLAKQVLPDAHADFTFAVVGDARAHAEWATVSAAIRAKNPRFAIQTGDNNDASGSAANWEDYYNVAKPFFANVTVFAAQGNHDGHLSEDPRVKPVHLLAGDAGGGGDLVARILAPGLGASLGQPLGIIMLSPDAAERSGSDDVGSDRTT